MEREVERRLQKIRYENRKVTVRTTAAVAVVARHALAFGEPIGLYLPATRPFGEP
jgi:hypothetical protein